MTRRQRSGETPVRTGCASRASCPGHPVMLRWAVELWKRKTLDCVALGAAGRPGPWLGSGGPCGPQDHVGSGALRAELAQGPQSAAGIPRIPGQNPASVGVVPLLVPWHGPSGPPALWPPLSLPASTHSAPGATEASQRPSLTPFASKYQRSVASPRKPALTTLTTLGTSSRLHSPMPPCFPARDPQHGGSSTNLSGEN